MNVLVINCGSSSLKFSVIEERSGSDLAKGTFEQLGSPSPKYSLQSGPNGKDQSGYLKPGQHHEAALDLLSDFLRDPDGRNAGFQAIGHRVVHGGEQFTEACRIDESTLTAIEKCSALAPLHNPSNLLGIRKALTYFEALPQVAVFDTSFHQTMPEEAYLYPLPIDLYETHKIRRYGFHGSSHKFVAQRAAEVIGKPLDQLNLISVHLGNGCSATAVEQGKSVDTTMGLTPLEGLVMGTRSGDIDPSIIFHLHRSLRMSIDDIDTLLNSQSGLLGLSGQSNDMRTLRRSSEAGDKHARLAIDIFVRRLAKTIAALRTVLPSLDALIFTGGIGENDPKTRTETIARLSMLGFEIDPAANEIAGQETQGTINSPSSSTKILVIPTNEELLIARETVAVLNLKTK